MLDALTPGIHDHTLSPQDRFNIQTDVYALARAGRLAYVDYLKLLLYAYKHEDNLTVWKSILRQLSELSSIFDYAYLNDTKQLYQSYVTDLLENVYQDLGWTPLKNESTQLTILRSLILTHMGVNEHRDVSREAHRRFETFFHAKYHPDFLDPNIRAAIYLTVAKTGDRQIYDQLKSVDHSRTFKSSFISSSSSSIFKQILKKNVFDYSQHSHVLIIKLFNQKH